MQIILLMQQSQTALGEINHNHPLSYLRQPELLNENPNSTLDIMYGILYSALPTIFSFELSRLPALIFIYFLGNYGTIQEFVEVGLGIIIAYILVYNIITTVNLGFAAACINISNSQVIGLMYQKTLAVNCFYCIAITPILYLSDTILQWFFFKQSSSSLAICKQVGIIIWGLVPSFYLSCFHDTTRNYLQAQGVLYQPIIIETACVTIQFLFSMLFIQKFHLGVMGAIWAKNISDGVYALTLYLYIVIYQPTKESWIQWSLLAATKNWKFFLRFVGLFVITKYIQALVFEITCLIVCRFVDLPAIAAQIYIANCIVLIRLAYLGIADAVNSSIYKSLIDKHFRIAFKKFKIGLLITFIFSGIVTYQILVHKQSALQLFTSNPLVTEQVQNIFPIILVIIFIQPIHAMISCFLSSLRMDRVIIQIDISSFYGISIFLGIYLCYYHNYGLLGIWIGWLTGLLVSISLMFCVLLRMNFNLRTESLLQEEQQFQKTIVQTVRESIAESFQQITPLNPTSIGNRTFRKGSDSLNSI